MFTLNFQKRFALSVKDGSKRQTLRAKRRDGRVPCAGDLVRAYCGMRTKSCEHLLDAECTQVEAVRIFDARFKTVIEVGGSALTNAQAYQLARDDGFGTLTEFLHFFRESHTFPFEGNLIKW